MSVEYDETLPLSKVPIWATVKAGYVQTYRNFGAFLTAAAVPFLLSLGFAAAFTGMLEGLASTIFSGAVEMAVAAMFSLAWYRHLLLQTAETRPVLLRWPGARLLAYIGYTWLLALTLLPSLLGTEQFDSSEADTAAGHLLYLSLIAISVALYVLAVYFQIRLGFALLWLSIDEPGRLGASWRLTKGNGLRLFVVSTLVVAPLVAAFIVGTVVVATVYPELWSNLETADPGSAEFWANKTADLVLSYLLYGLLGAAMVQAFRTLTGRPGDQREILERFE